MTVELPTSYHDLLNGANTAVLTTLQGDGSPNSSPVWYWFDGSEVAISTRAGRSKQHNIERDPRVSLTIVDPDRPLRYIEIRGTAEIEQDPAGEMRDRIATKHGMDGAAFDPPGSSRVTFWLTPTRVIEH